MIRGVDGQPIFAGDESQSDFLHRFAFLVRELGFVVLAWCLLGNHAHFVIRTGATPLGVLMARLGSRHAQRHNRTIARQGHLFQDRYKAVLVESDRQLACELAYVLGNPVRHGLMSIVELEHYCLGGFSALVGNRPPWEFESPRTVAAAIGIERAALRGFVETAALELGSPSAALEPDQIEELNALIRDCCRRHGVPEESLHHPEPGADGVRADICSRAARALTLPATEIAKRIGVRPWEARRMSNRVFIGVRPQ
jgi:REP element-mobilizing transposase RayT